MGAPRSAKRKEGCWKPEEENKEDNKRMVGSGRKAAQGVVYRERGGKRSASDDRIYLTEEKSCSSEEQALEETKSADEKVPKIRKIFQFIVSDESGVPQPLESLEYDAKDLYLDGSVYPLTGNGNKECGRKVTKIGPIVSYKIGGMEKDEAEVRILTKRGEYICVKPASPYKSLHAHLMEQASLYHAVARALSPRYGGSSTASLEELVSSLVRGHVVQGGINATRNTLANCYKFILNFLQRERKFLLGESVMEVGELPMIVSLREEFIKQRGKHAIFEGGITIRDAELLEPSPGAEAADFTMMDADEALARRLQAKEEAMAYGGGRQGKGSSGQAYIKIDESEISADYPGPRQYVKEHEEMDELLFFDEEMIETDPEYLPRRVLSDFSLYNSEGLLDTLELLPMWGGVDPDVELFASGVVLEDDGQWTGIQTTVGSSSSAEPSSVEDDLERGTRMFLSQIKEWIVEFSYDALFISFRTDVAWYRLKTPNHRYAPWFNVVLKASRVAVKCIGYVAEEKRASKLSFRDIVVRLSKESEEGTFISARASDIERYLVVHGQIVLNQFRNYPVKAVQNAAFVSALKSHMELRKHCKLYMSSKKVGRAHGPRSLNPVRSMAARRKPMPATTTSLVHRVWSTYFNARGTVDGKSKEEEQIQEIEEEEDMEEEEATEEFALAESGPEYELRQFEERIRPIKGKIRWTGEATSTHETGLKMYEKVSVGISEFGVGMAVVVKPIEDDDQETRNHPAIVWVTRLYETKSNEKMLHGLVLTRGSETVLGEAANQMELFLTWEYVDMPVSEVLGSIKVEILHLPWGSQYALENEKKYSDMLSEFTSKLELGEEVTYIFRKLYDPLSGAFRDLPRTGLGENSWDCPMVSHQRQLEENSGIHILGDQSGFRKDGITYQVGMYVYVDPSVFDYEENIKADLPDYVKNCRIHKGGSQNLRAFGIGEILAIGKPVGKPLKPGKITIRRFYRPEDVSKEHQYRSRMCEVYWSETEHTVYAEALVGCCQIVPAGFSTGENIFVCTHSFDPKNKSLSAPPTTIHPTTRPSLAEKAKVVRAPDKGKGCGGLSEGMHQAGVADTRWAIEYEKPAAEAFQLNNPSAIVFNQNCNVVLYKAMEVNGRKEHCNAADECSEEASKLPDEVVEKLPAPGEVDFICGGPPCQGYSGMNRFNRGTWSKVQNEMVLAYLSFADFYRPRFWLLENVRNFVSFNKGQTFRLVIRSLLEMGYQVRFGVLNAANYGVAQSRKRAFIWACAPGEIMPEWPSPMHVFKSPQLTIKLPGGVLYTAVPQMEGAPLRAVTVRDVIGDLPPIENGCEAQEVEYTRPPVSEFQALIRGSSSTVKDHVCKLMNELNLERCKCIPRNTPGADWRELLRIVEADPSREWYKGPGMREKQKLVPWCLPNTADRHNGWRGLYSRLDWDGHFPTATTDPNPMGKVGQVFHPEQDRIVSVRECARSQGFPDSFHLVGNVNMKHRQVGNAVPVPLARALGQQLLKSIQEKQRLECGVSH